MKPRKGALSGWMVAAGLFAGGAHAQAPSVPVDARMLGFELGTVNGMPAGWFGMPPETIGVDTTEKHGGGASVRLERVAGSPGTFSFISRGLPLEFAGKTITLEGWLRREGAGVPSLWMRQDDANGSSIAFVDMSANPEVATQWGAHSISFAVTDTARQLVIGVRLVGDGKSWADDLELRVDGKLLADAPRAARAQTILEKDQEFAGGSRIELATLSARQLDTLVLTAKVWGFLKYHHPAVTGGTQHWDFALFRQLPKLLESRSAVETQRLLAAWVDSLGPVPACTACLSLDAAWLVKPRLRWIDDAGLSGRELSDRLRAIHRHRRAEQFYVRLAPGVGNPVFDNEAVYGQARIPDAGLQLLAVMRFWNMVEYWFPYRDLIDEDWDVVLRESLERVGTARDFAAYQRELAALIARADDGHANAQIGPAQPPEGQCVAPVILRHVEGRFVVKSVWEGTGVDLEAGDVVTAIDDRAVTDIVKEVRRYYGASNESARMHNIAQWLTRGACGPAKMTVQRAARADITIQRVAFDWPKLMAGRRNDRAGDTLQWLTPKVAYLKLSSIKQADVERYVRDIAAADALVIDIRNYPSDFVVFALGNLLVDKRTPFVTFTNADLGNPGAFGFGPTMNVEPAQPHFAGRVAVLVDETSISNSEYTTMALRASPRAMVVGSQTAGADGNVSPIALPGNVRTGFTGIGVYYPDRTPTQQVGVKIDVPCRPTIAGIRAGRDEVLDCALKALAQKGD
jgi:C-terminal processing protease CtpA/Prc